MTFNIRPICWEDIKIDVGWLDSKDNTRIYASLKKCSFVGVTLWIPEWTNSPAQKAVIMLTLTRKLLQTIEKLDYYVQ